jgi:hypothetical protein
MLAVGIAKFDNDDTASWLEANHIHNDTMSWFIASIYFIVSTISTIGYGDITAQT